MVIKSLRLENFRNYKKQYIELKNGINVFYGNNAQGKTNLLEAIFVCAIGKSFRTNKDREFVNFEALDTKVDVEFEKSDRSGKISLELGEKKRFLLNDVVLKKTSQVLGNVYVVLFTPDDIAILKEEPANRRRFLDIMISQLRPNYMRLLFLYKKTMQQRNSYLKQIKFENKSLDLLDVWDMKLSELGKQIFAYRREFVDKLSCKIADIHRNITDNKESISIEYCSSFMDNSDFYKSLVERRVSDIQRGITSIRCA